MDDMLTEELNRLIEETSVLDVLLVLSQVLSSRSYHEEADLVAKAAEI